MSLVVVAQEIGEPAEEFRLLWWQHWDGCIRVEIMSADLEEFGLSFHPSNAVLKLVGDSLDDVVHIAFHLMNVLFLIKGGVKLGGCLFPEDGDVLL